MTSAHSTRRYLPVLIYLALLAIGVPWYWPSDDVGLVLGMPAWVAVAIAASIVASCYTVYLLYTSWPESFEADR